MPLDVLRRSTDGNPDPYGDSEPNLRSEHTTGLYEPLGKSEFRYEDSAERNSYLYWAG